MEGLAPNKMSPTMLSQIGPQKLEALLKPKRRLKTFSASHNDIVAFLEEEKFLKVFCFMDRPVAEKPTSLER